MRAIQFTRFGGPEVLELVEVPEPHATAKQIRVVVNAVGVNPVDWKFRQGTMGGELPQGTGLEVAGVVDEVGDGITDVAAGDAVFGSARAARRTSRYWSITRPSRTRWTLRLRRR